MGKVKLTIVGYNKPYIFDKNVDNITLKDIYILLIHKGILLKKIVNCKFIYNGKILELNKDTVTVYNTVNIYIIIQNNDKEFKTELIKTLFNINIDSELNDTLDEVEEIELNNDLCDYFKDKDFINLLNIVKTKPHYLEMVNSYLSHGDIVEDINFEHIDIENFEYAEQLSILNKNVMPHISNWDEEKVKKLLIQYKGNVNLTSRYILI